MANKEEQQDLETQEVDSELQNIIEAALYASSEPLGIRRIISMFPDDAQPSKVDIQNVILNLEEKCEHRGVELRRIGKGWRFQSKEKYATWLRKLGAQKPPRYSRALLETLAIIAYRQPVTRSDIEEIRGVGVSSETIRTLEEREWVSQIGHRDVPGRPALFGTTQGFLEYFSMTSLRELPELMDKRQLGEIAKDMNLTLPMDGVQDEEDAAADAESKEHRGDQKNSEEEVGAQIIELHPSGEANTDPDLEGSAESSVIPTEISAEDSSQGAESDQDDESAPADRDE